MPVNLGNAIDAVHSGEAAIRVIFDWVERRSNWKSVVIVTSDHGHYLVLDDPGALAPVRARCRAAQGTSKSSWECTP